MSAQKSQHLSLPAEMTSKRSDTYMEWILGILILVLGGAAIIVIYLSERISVFETLLDLIQKLQATSWPNTLLLG